jgi:Flp pilus assembly protein TadG
MRLRTDTNMTRRGTRLPRLGRGERGVAVVEFAVVLPLLLLIVLGIMDFGRAMNYKNAATQLANEAARFLTVNRDPVTGAPPTCGALKSYLKTQADTTELSTMLQNGTLAISFPSGGANIGDPVRVTVTTTFGLLPFTQNQAGLLPTIPMTGRATMRLEQQPAFGGSSC